MYAQRNLNRITETLTEQINSVATIALDYADWDDTYQFVSDKNEEYQNSYVTDDNFGSILDLDFITFIDRTEQLIAHWERNKALSITTSDIERLVDLAKTKVEGVDGTLTTTKGPAIISIKPIHKTNRTGERNGYLITGRYLDGDAIARLGQITKLDVDFLSPTDPNYEESRVAVQIRRGFSAHHLQLRTFIPVDDVFGQPTGIIQVTSFRDIYQEAHNTDVYFMGIVLFVFIVASLSTQVLNESIFSQITSRVELLRQDMERAIENHDSTCILPSVKDSTGDELSQLAVTLDKMRHQMYQSQSQLQAMVDLKTAEISAKLSHEEKMTEAMKLLLARAKRTNAELILKEQELEAANRQLIKLDKMKNDFLSNVNHELRTPLTSIRMYNQLLYDGDLGKVTTTQKDALKEILTASDHLLQIIKDILDLKKLEEGKFTFSMAPNQIEAVMSEVKTNLKGLMQEYQTKVSFRTTRMKPFIFDKTKLIEVMQNLIGNSLKYNRDHHPVQVEVVKTLVRKKSLCEIKVIDHCIGIKQQDQHRLFDKFYRVEAVLTQKTEGTGLGLSITKQIIKAHHGTISVESKYNQGTTVTVRLPMELPEAS